MKWFRFKTIRSRLLFLFLVESLIITTSIIGVSEYFSIDTLQKHIDSSSKTIVDVYSQKIGMWLCERLNEVSIYASLPAVREMDWVKAEPFLKSEMERKKGIYIHLFIADLKGSYNTTIQRSAGNVFDRDYFQNALKGKESISSPVISKSTGRQVSVVAVPIYNNNKIVGMMGAAIDLINLYQWISGFKIDYPQSYSYIVNRDGVIITHPKKEYIMNLVITNNFKGVDPAVSLYILSNKSGSVLYTFDGIKAIAYFHEISNTGGWKIVTRIPTDYFEKSIGNTRNALLAAGLLFVMAAIILGIWLARSVSQPIIALKNVFHQGIEGNLSVRAVEKPDDEIGEAGKYFNHLMDRYNLLLEQLKEEQSSLQEYVDHLLTYNGKLSMDGDILMLNATASERISPDGKNSIGSKIWEIDWFKGIKDAESLTRASLKKVADGETISEERSLKISDNEFLAVDFSLHPVFEKEGKVSYIVMEARDITDRVKLEDELLNARKLEAVGLLAGGIAHDFNNMMTAVLGMVSLSKNYTKPGDEIYEKLEIAEKASRRAIALTKQLLTFSRGGLPVKKLIEIKTLLADSAEMMTKGSNIQLETQIPGDLWSVEADEGQLSQVFNNITVNAVQSMPGGGNLIITAGNIHLTEHDHPVVPKGNYVKIDFKDFGIGIPKENLEKIFDPYFTTKKEGTGLGLATSYSIIKKHGGFIFAVSERGKGSVFTLYLPASNKAENQALSGGNKKITGKILIMDDDETVLSVAGNILTFFGFEVDFAAKGEEALLKYKKSMEKSRKYDILILDLTIIGGMGGKDTLEALKIIDPTVKAIASSGYSNDPVLANYQSYGFVAVIEKPYVAEILVRAVKDILKKV